MGAAVAHTTSEPPAGMRSSGYSSESDREGFIAPLDERVAAIEFFFFLLFLFFETKRKASRKL